MIRTDKEIKKDVIDELVWDSRIDASRINVSVHDGVVTLGGEVPSYRTQRIAKAAAGDIEGVVDVVNELTVKYISPPAIPGDDKIQEQIIDMLTWEPTIYESLIHVRVEKGEVILEGNVDGFWKKVLVEELLSSLRGVQKVVNLLSIAPIESVEDETIADHIVEALKRESLVDPKEINVSVKNGVVTLFGKVNYPPAIYIAERDAALTKGVVEVINNLELVKRPVS